MNRILSCIATAAVVATSAGGQTITGYDVFNTRLSGFGVWSHTYTGAITPNGAGLWDYTGGTGTMADGALGANNANSHLFVLADNPSITVYLNGFYKISSLTLRGAIGDNNSIPGTLTGATIGIGVFSAALSSTDFTPGCLSGFCDDAFDIAISSLAGVSGNAITISNVQGGSQGFFSISEIEVSGTVVTPEPSTVTLLVAGLGALVVAMRQRRRV